MKINEFWVLCFLGLLIGLSTGCSSTSVDRGTLPPPVVDDKADFRLVEDTSPQIDLYRGGAQYRCRPPKDFGFLVGDAIKNLSKNPVSVRTQTGDCIYRIKADGQTRLHAHGCEVQVGMTDFELNGAEFVIKVPKAEIHTGMVKATIMVLPTGATLVQVFDGEIVISQHQEKTTLKKNHAAIIPAYGSKLGLDPSPEAVVKFLKIQK